MKPPPLLLGAALLFWGWRVDLLAVGAVAGGLLELSHGIRARWDFSDKELNRLWDVCTVIFIAVAAYLRFAEEITSGAYRFFQWMPLIFFPMALGCTFGIREGVPMKAFSWFLRRKGAQGAERPIAFGWVYFAVTMITAGASNDRDIWFYIGFALLTGVALWSIRPRRIPEWAWVTIFLIIATSGFFGQSKMQDLQAFFEGKVSDFFVKYGRRDFDPRQTRTSMGHIGSLKQSGRIVMKVRAESGLLPERLRQCTYATLDGATWRSHGRSFDKVPVEPDVTTWTLIQPPAFSAAARIIERVNRRSALLSVPLGTAQLRDLAVGEVETNYFSVVRVKENPGVLNYTAHFGRNVADAEPNARDWIVPAEEEDAIQKIADELSLDALPDEGKPQAIVNFFQEKFRYTTFQAARALGLHAMTPLSEFLLKTRAGHCEYFASATVLLLRHFNIPARYATGYAVQEQSREDDFYVIRERHAHAWALAFIGGRWVEVDSTPAGWDQAESQEFPFYQDLKDAWENFTFGFLEWRWLGDWGVMRIVAPWAVAPLIGFLAWRIFGRRMLRRQPRPRDLQSWPGTDSEFYQLEKRLARAGFGRANEETTSEWLARVAAETPALADVLSKVMRFHYKYRFNPDGLAPSERAELRQMVRACLGKL